MDTMTQRDLFSIASSLASIADSYQPTQALSDIADAANSILIVLGSIDGHLVELIDRES